MPTTTRTSSPRKTATALLKMIWALAHKWKLSEDDLRELNFECNNTRRLSRLNDSQANRLIKRLGGKTVSRRTVQHNRQIAGVVQTKTAAHIIKLREWGSKVGFDDHALRTFCKNQIGVEQPLTTKQTNQCIEPLKAMFKRGWRANQTANQQEVS